MGQVQRQLMQALLLCLFIASKPLSATSESEALCGDCYRIDTVTLVGVVLGDILLTVIIILVVYFCTKQTFQKRSVIDDKKIYMNMPGR
ncbi:hematopoietic cell signal transducer [Bombina bombina]|uniref:hematopoietic cell signal transducer n=1 Tax=Bombina bombina TaxID=8345 RepID=UPI00235A798D|nr:hematopoietic cell signal transducer [Bombina bombina]XP_053552899.1 hematopoietic cell signal transducer [Bombina bombina]